MSAGCPDCGMDAEKDDPRENFTYYTCGTRAPKARFAGSVYHYKVRSFACRRIVGLQERNIELQAALTTYGVHPPGCGGRFGGRCDCGLLAVMNGVRPTPDTGKEE